MRESPNLARKNENEGREQRARDLVAANDNIEGEVKPESIEAPLRITHLNEILPVIERNPQIKAVTFDMFDTLVQWTSTTEERKALVYSRMSDFFRQHGVDMTGEEILQKREEHKRVFASVPGYKTGDEYRMRDVLARLCGDLLKDSLPSDEEDRSMQLEVYAAQLENIVAEIDADTAVPMPGAKEVLEQLKEKGIRIGVISNFTYSGDAVRHLLHRFGFMQYFDTGEANEAKYAVVVSSEAGARKSGSDPEGRIFKTAADRLQVDTNEMIHVGDEPRADHAGPERIGMRGIVYDNPNSAQKRLKGIKLTDKEYVPTCLDIQKEALRENASQYFDHYEKKNDVEYPASFKEDCLAMYEATLESYGPVLVKFSEHNLDLLKADTSRSINLCTGRDALAMFLIQRKLIETFPEKYAGVDVNRIQYLPVSRKMILQTEQTRVLKDPEQAITYLRDQLASGRESSIDLDTVTKIRFIDSGVEGKIQDAYTAALPEKQVTGEYIMSNKTATGKPEARNGFLVEFSKLPYTDAVVTGYPKLWNSEFLRKSEDLFNGIRVSPISLETRQGVLRPTKQSTMIQTTPPGRAELMPGLEMNGGYELYKRLILKALLDSIHAYKREAQLGAAPSVEDVARGLEAWHEKSENDPQLRRILNATVRKREHIDA